MRLGAVRLGAGDALATMLVDCAAGSRRDGKNGKFRLNSKVQMEWMAAIGTKTIE